MSILRFKLLQQWLGQAEVADGRLLAVAKRNLSSSSRALQQKCAYHLMADLSSRDSIDVFAIAHVTKALQNLYECGLIASKSSGEKSA